MPEPCPTERFHVSGLLELSEKQTSACVEGHYVSIMRLCKVIQRVLLQIRERGPGQVMVRLRAELQVQQIAQRRAAHFLLRDGSTGDTAQGRQCIQTNPKMQMGISKNYQSISESLRGRESCI